MTEAWEGIAFLLFGIIAGLLLGLVAITALPEPPLRTPATSLSHNTQPGENR